MGLFDENHRYTNEALHLEIEIRSALWPIFEAAIAKGVSPRELAYLTFQAGNDLSLEFLCGPPPRRSEHMCSARRAEVVFLDGTKRIFVAWPWRGGWHACPPCNDSQPVYATPADAAIAHATGMNPSGVFRARTLP